MSELKNVDKLHPEIQTVVAQYCQEMLKLHEGYLKSIIVYGSAAGSHYIPKR